MPGFSPVKSSRVSVNFASRVKNAILGGEVKPEEKLLSGRVEFIGVDPLRAG